MSESVPAAAAGTDDVGARPVGVGVVDVRGVVLEHDPEFARELGGASIGLELADLVGSRYGERHVAELTGALSADTSASIAVGEMHHVRIGPVQTGRREVRIERPTTVADVAGLADHHPAATDPLTGLGNRRRLDEVLRRWERLGDLAPPLVVLMIDLDRFKAVNDSLGHGIGDRVLSLVASRIASATRRDEEVIRMGGDEFVVLHAGADPTVVEAIAARIVEFMRRPFLIEGHQVHIGASIGIAALDGTSTPDELLRHADLALYEAKAAGRDTFRHFRPALARRADERRDMETRVRRALALRQLSLHYQPQIRASDGGITGFEALLRWTNDVDGEVPPATLIPIAEEIGEIHAIGQWVLREACRTAVRWPDELSVSVNVSRVQFERDGFADVVERALGRSGLPGERLVIEVRESALFEASPNVLDALEAISALGVRIAIDDFGSGFSALARLEGFPFSSVKIDQSFVREDPSEQAAGFVGGLIAMGRRLGLATVAEGVETTERAAELVAEGCAELQGFLISRPMPADRIETFIAERTSDTEQGGGA